MAKIKHTAAKQHHPLDIIAFVSLTITILTSFMLASVLATTLGQGLGYFAALPKYALHQDTAKAETLESVLLSDAALYQSLESTFEATSEGRQLRSDHEESVRVSTLLYRNGTSIYIEVDSRRDTTTGNAPWESTLTGFLTTNPGFGPYDNESRIVRWVELPQDTVKIQSGGRRVTLAVDLSEVPGVQLIHSTFYGSEFTEDLSILPSTIINLSWDIGNENNLKYGGRIRTTYDRPDGGRAQSDDTLEHHQATAAGTAFGSETSWFSLNRSEYIASTHNVSKSAEDVIAPDVEFPPEPGLPPEP